MASTAEFVDDHLLRIGELEFHCVHPIGHIPPGRLPVEKPRELVEDYIELCAKEPVARIVEVGIYKGGSTAMLSALADPLKLVSIEISEGPLPILTQYIEKHDLIRRVRPYFGVDQSDRRRLAEIVHAEFEGERIDVVIDDASHLYDESRVTFEALFPHVRPGGWYIIEDWRWQHQMVEGMSRSIESGNASPELEEAIVERMIDIDAGRAQRVVPLSRLAIELVLARAASGGEIAEVRIGAFWTWLRRGPAPLDAATFRVSDIVRDHFSLLSARAEPK